MTQEESNIIKPLTTQKMEKGNIKYLIKPYKGYRAVELIERTDLQWIVRICDSGLELTVYEDELTDE